MNVSLVLTSAATLEVISFKLLVSPASSTSRSCRSAALWCESRGLTLASKARHADLASGVDATPFAGVSALAALKEKHLAGELPAGSVLLVDSIPGLAHLHFIEMILQLAELSRAGVTLVTLNSAERAWANDLATDLGAFMLTVAELALLQEQRYVRSQRTRMSHQQRRECKAQAGEVAQ